MKAKIYSGETFDWQFECQNPVTLWIDTFEGFPGSGGKKVFVAMEPFEISKLKQQIIDHASQFDIILTYDTSLLQTLKNAHLMTFGTSWIRNYTYPEKEFGISMVCGEKSQTEGHRLRHRLWGLQNKIDIPHRFFISRRGQSLVWKLRSWWRKQQGNPVLGESKIPLFDSQFHLAIENSKTPHYFSEKLIDAFITKTIPIYWGCPNIDRYFNPDGIISIQSAPDAIAQINALVPEDYLRRRAAIEDNYTRALSFVDYPSRLENRLRELGIL